MQDNFFNCPVTSSLSSIGQLNWPIRLLQV